MNDTTKLSYEEVTKIIGDLYLQKHVQYNEFQSLLSNLTARIATLEEELRQTRSRQAEE